ncbi:MAG: DUF664 domain-containing protein [Gemmatimonadaceae bacterium]|nr:DUF664 domain-containing protein [Gemmatimonadaceae bacterium]
MSDVSAPAVIAPEALLSHWQGHRRVTRRVIEAFPADEFTTLSIGGMRPFSAMAQEMLSMAVPTLRGILTGEWAPFQQPEPTTQAKVLAEWDAATAELDTLFGQIPLTRFQEQIVAFGQWPMSVHDLILGVIDNEIHHRGQGYVYLRALGVTPPEFWVRD